MVNAQKNQNEQKHPEWWKGTEKAWNALPRARQEAFFAMNNQWRNQRAEAHEKSRLEQLSGRPTLR